MRKIQNKLKNSHKLQSLAAFLALLLLAAGLFAIAPCFPDAKTAAIRKELQEQGCNTRNIDFKFVMAGEGYGEYIFQSSEPVYYKGHYVYRWSVFCYSISPPITHYYVRPYPALPEPKE